MAHAAHTSQSDIWSELRDELHPNRLISGVAAGVVVGVLEIMIAVAFASMIFSGEMSGYLSRGIGFMLFSLIVCNLITALTSSFRPVVYSPQDNPAAIMALTGVAIADSVGSANEGFVTLVAALTLTALATGTAFLLLGALKQGNLVRYIPYPVVGGFLAGIGVLLVLGAISVMTGVNVSPTEPDAFTHGAYLVKWLPGMLFAVLLLLALRRFRHPLLMPGMLVGAIVVFYLTLALSGTSIAEAKDEGWLLESFPETQGGLWEPVSPADWDAVNWPVLGDQIGNFAAIVITSVIALLLNATGYELATNQDADLNRELKVTGAANVLAGLGGGLVGYMGLGPSMLSARIGGRMRLSGVVLALLAAVILLAGGSLLAYFPVPLLGGLLFLLGLDFLVTWLVDIRNKLPLTDYLIVVLIMVVINLVGFLEGIGVGIAVSGVLFVVSYSRIAVVRGTLSGAEFRSSVIRSPSHERLLLEQSTWTHINKLQGYLFFGTANRMLEQIRASLQTEDRPRSVVFDFKMVSGLDSSAVLSFARMRQLAHDHDVALCFSHMSPPVFRQLARDVFQGSEDPVCCTFPDLDHAVEWCENRILDQLQSAGVVPNPQTLHDGLAGRLNSTDYAATLMLYLERQEVDSRHIVMRQGDPPRGLFFIESGQITIRLEREGAPPLRIRKMSAGTIVGEMGFYLNQPASATVITDLPSTLYRLSPDALSRLAREHPDVATAFHASMACFLAERLTQTTRTLQMLVE